MEADKFEAWAIVEIFGHQTFAGKVTEQVIGGASFVRVDVPMVNGSDPFTKFFGASAIYSITPVSEELARKAVTACHSEPLLVYIPQGQLPANQSSPSPRVPHSCSGCGNDCYCPDNPCSNCEDCNEKPF